jgi:hypothetical protein
LQRRIGAANADFKALCRVWSHTSITRSKKIRILDACVVSKLLYCLHTLWLNASEVRRINSFYVRCLRKVLRIPPSFISRVSNQIVLDTAGRQNLSDVLQKRQMTLMAKLAKLPHDSILRKSVFAPGGFELRQLLAKQKRGRPRACWPKEVYKLCLQAAGDLQTLHQYWLRPA